MPETTKKKIGLYSLISRKSDLLENLVKGAFFVILMVLIALSKKIFDDQNVSFYTFSTIVQGFLALIGLLGTVVVFRLQLIEQETEKISNILVSTLNFFIPVRVHEYSLSALMIESKKILDNKKHEEESPGPYYHLETMFSNLENLGEQKTTIRNTMVDFSIVSLTNITVALLGLPLSKLFILNGWIPWLGVYLTINLTLSFFSVLAAFRIIRKCLGYSFKIEM